ncbi:MAG TPA: serine/threonine-protein kinase [Polyangiaceae bacterium]|jgi:serine/threonine-protein kinase|nr:serine/threonine-protein kinase [Polyangiaceae bacterium]
MSPEDHSTSRVPFRGELLAGRWRVERALGSGSMGVVLAARDVESGRRVAIKLLMGEGARSPKRVARFMREARAAAALTSEHVARVLHTGKLASGAAFLVMEYLEGENLRELLAKRPLPLATCIDYLLQAAEAIAEAHQRGIVHRDIKPANLFITRRRDGSACIKVLDFGLSKITSDSAAITHTSALLGSPLYMAPEQLSSAKHVDYRADVWSLGVVLFEMLSLETPFFGETLYEVVAGTLYGKPRRLRDVMIDVPPGLDEVLAHCLAKDRRCRIQTVAELADALVPFGGPGAAASAETIRLRLRGGTRLLDMAELSQHASEDEIIDEPTTIYQSSNPPPMPVDPRTPLESSSSKSYGAVAWTPSACVRRSAEWITLAAIVCVLIGGIAAYWSLHQRTVADRAPEPKIIEDVARRVPSAEVVPASGD